MRNVFDQYDQPENRLTHALMITLANDKKLIRPFLKLVRVKKIPALNKIQLGLQCVPGQEVDSNKDGKEGLPDGCFFDQDDWAVIIEAKVQAGLSVNQLKRHRKTSARYGYEQPYVVLLSIDKPKSLPDWVTHLEWKNLYNWFSRRTADSSMPERLAAGPYPCGGHRGLPARAADRGASPLEFSLSLLTRCLPEDRRGRRNLVTP